MEFKNKMCEEKCKIFSEDSKYYEMPRMVPVEISHFHLHRGYHSKCKVKVFHQITFPTLLSVFTAVSKACVRVPDEQQQEIKSILNGNYLNKV